MLAQFNRYLQTGRHLKPRQIYHRLARSFRRPTPDLRPAPLLSSPQQYWSEPVERPLGMLGPTRFRFLNVERELTGAGDWNRRDWDRLWLYNLHYHHDLTAPVPDLGWSEALIHRWINENPPGQGTGWEPYPISLRTVNWIKWALAGNRLDQTAVHSLAVQIRFLSEELEEDLLANHLFANAKALIFAALFFSGREAERWEELGIKLLSRELPEQVLPDGGHFERSPMYHSAILEDVLDLINVTRAYPSRASQSVRGELERVAPGMCAWLGALSHPDGEIALFNDAAFGIAAAPAHLHAYAARLGIRGSFSLSDGVTLLRDSGYFRLQRDDAVLLGDVGPIGPDYQPGHAHADTLSFELSVYGTRVIVDSGTSTYENGRDRWRQRSTGAHNTVEIDGENSSEVWGAFRVARRARPIDLEISERDGVVIRCGHDGYKRLPGRVLHHREWRLQGNELGITDILSGKYDRAISRFHFHPRISPAANPASASAIEMAFDNCLLVWKSEDAPGKIETGFYHPEFGSSVPNNCIVSQHKNARVHHQFSWKLR